MFERFTGDARRIVVAAFAIAAEAEDGEVGSRHLLVALADGDGPAGEALRAEGVTAARLREHLARRHTGTGAGVDADALAAIGIDLDKIRRAADESFGAGALDRSLRRAGGSHRRWWRGPRGRLPFRPDAKLVLERSLRQTLARGDRAIGSEHILLGLLAVPTAERLLAGCGTDVARVRRALLERIGDGRGRRAG